MAPVIQNAHDFVLNNPQFIDNSKMTIRNPRRDPNKGLNTLRRATIPEAAHDSSARYPPPRCHPGTRKKYIKTITNWAHDSNSTPPGPRILWMKGPAGVGKSAIAQTCAEDLAERTGAAFFFSRPNARDDPNRFFTSIAYQFAMRFRPYREIINQTLKDDPTVISKSLKQQFHALIVTPFQRLKSQGIEVEDRVVFVDGLDECKGDNAQHDILRIIASSVRDKQTPFTWAFFSRPEPHIVAILSSAEISPLCHAMELHVSREADEDIRLYLTDGFCEVRKQWNLPSSWPRRGEVQALVDMSAGLFVYAATVIRFVADPDSFGPEDQLQLVLSLAKHCADAGQTAATLSELDLFYTLIMQRVPAKVLPTLQRVLLAITFLSDRGSRAPADEVTDLLCLSWNQLEASCYKLHSVLKIKGETCDVKWTTTIRFYHASFIDFIVDPYRSREFCVMSACAVSLRRDLLYSLNAIHQTSRFSEPSWSIRTLHNPDENQRSRNVLFIETYQNAVRGLFRLSQTVPLDDETAQELAKFDYKRMINMITRTNFNRIDLDPVRFFDNVPAAFRDKIIRPYDRGLFYFLRPRPLREGFSWNLAYVLGRKKKKILVWRPAGPLEGDADTEIIPFPYFLP